MSAWTLLLISVGVSADAMAVAVGKGLHMRRFRAESAVVLASTFAIFQAIMPLLGWFLGSRLRRYITEIDHWVAFALLAAIGIRMVWEAFHPSPDESSGDRVGTRELLVLGLATSVDALAVGITLAFLDVAILAAAVVIGVTTFVLSLVGVYIGHRAGSRFRGPAEILGGLILIAIGVRVLLDHLGVW